MERQIDRIKKAEQAMKELLEVAAALRRQIEQAGSKDPNQIRELLEAAEGFEKEAQRMRDALRNWRQDIN